MGRWAHLQGTGTLGEPLAALLLDQREALALEGVTVYKHSLTDLPKLRLLQRRGAKLAVAPDLWDSFVQVGIQPDLTQAEALDRAAVVADCTPHALAQKEALYLPREARALGFLAHGSERGFGTPYVRGVNEAGLERDGKYLMAGSCNLHTMACLIDTFGLAAGPEGMAEGTFLCVRRAQDVGQAKDHLPAPQAGRHLEVDGTHHARDARALFATLGMDLALHSSAIKVPTSYLHTIWFDFRFTRDMDLGALRARAKANPRLALTDKADAGLVYSFGRDHGYMGRLLNQAVLPWKTMTMPHPRRLVGCAFTPQDGNSLLTSLSALARWLHPTDWERRLAGVEALLWDEV